LLISSSIADAETAVMRHRIELESEQARTEERASAVTRLEVERDELKQALEKVQSQMLTMEESNTYMRQQVRSTEGERDTIAAEKQRCVIQMSSLKLDYESLQSHSQRADAEREELSAEKDRLAAQVIDLLAQKGDEQTAADKRIAELNSALRALQSQLNTANEENEEMKPQVKGLETRVAILQAESRDYITSIRSKDVFIEQMKSDNEKLESDLEVLNRRLQNAMARVSKLESDYSTSEANNLDLRHAQQTLTDELEREKLVAAALQRDVRSLQMDMQERDRRIDSLQTELDTVHSRMEEETSRLRSASEALQAKLTPCELELERLRKELAQMAARNEELQKRLEAETEKARLAKQELQGLQHQQSRSDRSSQELEADLLKAARDREALNERYNKLLAEQRKRDEEIASLKNEMYALQGRLLEMQKVEEDLRRALNECKGTLANTQQRNALHCWLLKLHKNTVMNFACAFYHWSQLTKDGALVSSASELSIMTNIQHDEKRYDYFDIEALDVRAVAAGYGL